MLEKEQRKKIPKNIKTRATLHVTTSHIVSVGGFLSFGFY